MKYKNNILFSTVLILLTCLATTIYGQAIEVDLMGQGNRNEVKLLWFPKRWPSNLDGFNVKRKTKVGNWQKLNTEVIVPSTKKEHLSFITNDFNTINRLEAKTDQLIEENRIPNLTATEMKARFLSDDTSIKFFSFGLSVEYDYALIQGMAYYDIEVPSTDTYTYGLFPVTNGVESSEPIDTYEWKYGSRPDISVEHNVDIKKIRKRQGIEVTWNIPTEQTREKRIKGFHTYIKDSTGNSTRITKLPTRVNMKDEVAQIFHIDNEYDVKQKATFYLVPVDLFDTEGQPMEVQYTSQAFPMLEAPVLEIKNDSLQNGIELIWNFNPINNKRILRFEVGRRESVNEAKTTITNISVADRSYIDTGIPKTGFYFYTITAIGLQGQQLESNEYMIYKDITPTLRAPQNLTGAYSKSQEIGEVILRWNPVPSAVGYYLYTDGIMTTNSLARQASIDLIEENTYRHPVNSTYGRLLHFAISAVDKDTNEGPISNTVEVFIPSSSLPQVNVWPVERVGKVVTLNWKYLDSIEDLVGFRVYQNGEMVISEEKLNSSTRKWISTRLTPGNHTFEVEAISQFGVKSKISKPRKFNITEE